MATKEHARNLFDKKEGMSPAERQDYYDKSLSRMIQRGYKQSETVRQLFSERKIKPSDIKSVKHLEKLPVISREELVRLQMAKPPFAGFSPKDVMTDRIFTSPGPVYEPHLTEKDPIWSRGYYAAGFGKGDIVLNAFSYHMVAAGLTFHSGLRRVGATVVPSGTSSTENQVQLIRDLGVTGYTGTPSFLMAIIKKAEEMGYNFRDDFKVRKASFVAEPLQPSLREQFEREYTIDTYQMYGATEVGDIAYECGAKKHWHVCEEVIVEIVDPSTGRQVAPGQLGEVVVTRLNDLFFLFRFGTGDLSSMVKKKCSCGRTSYSLTGISGRVGEAAKVRGMFIAPSQLKMIGSKLPVSRIQAVVQREGFKDLLIIRIENEIPGSGKQDFEEQVRQNVKAVCGLTVDRVDFVDTGAITEKDRLIIDQRNWQ